MPTTNGSSQAFGLFLPYNIILSRMAYDDALWGILESLHMADFFEEHDLPPLLLPIMILAAAALISFVILSPSAEEALPANCGDAICQAGIGEDSDSCPQDCAEAPATTRTVLVDIIDPVKDEIEVRLENPSGRLIYSTSSVLHKFKITRVEEEVVKVTVINPASGKSISSDLVELWTETTQIPIGLPPDFFEASSDAISASASLRVTVKDASTNGLIGAKVTLVIPNEGSYIVVKSQDVDGLAQFSLDANQWYAVIVDSPGYAQYNTLPNPIRLQPEAIREITAAMEALPLSGSEAQPALLHACVRDPTSGVVSTGSLHVYDASGTEVATQILSPTGCSDFELPPTGIVTVSTANLPDSCTNAVSNPLELRPGRIDIALEVTCDSGNQGRIRVKVIGENGEIVTQNAIITAWYANGQRIYAPGPSNSLQMGSGGYTQYLRVTSSKPLHLTVSGLSGYATHRSSGYTVAPAEDKSIDLHMTPPPVPEFNITFQGASYPDPTFTDQVFTVTIPTVLYGQSDITGLANVSVELAGSACQISKGQFWVARCTSPSEMGTYDLSLSATYEGKQGVDVKQLRVFGRGLSLFTLSPRPLLDTRSPIDLEMDITFNSTTLDSLTDSRVTVIYEDGGVTVTDQLSLSGGDGLYTLEVDSPFSGEHRAAIYLNKILHGKIYEQNFTVTFISRPTSVMVTFQDMIDPIILEPAETFGVNLRILDTRELPGLRNVFFILEGERLNLPWNPSSHTYQKALTSPNEEGTYPVLFELGPQALTNRKIYVVDTTKDKASECPIALCQNIPQVRKCVYEYRYEDLHSEEETVRCIEQGWMNIGGISLEHCRSPSAGRGDWNNNCVLDSEGYGNDIQLMEEFLRKILDQQERGTYAGCGDMDDDGDVDDSDLTCLKNVASTKWFGELGDKTCSKPMRGGFCFDIGVGLPGDYDLNDKFDSKDSGIMQKILNSTI